MELLTELKKILDDHINNTWYDHYTLEFIEKVKNTLVILVHDNKNHPELTSKKPLSIQIGKKVDIHKLIQFLSNEKIPFNIKSYENSVKPSELIIDRYSLMILLTTGDITQYD